ncbi:site-specific integrase [Brucella anthropi]|uniref:Phage integrase family protein n=1 Tax=Brucella anthropi (strain ATCC 49188 / DSM 6882 / CCUG 24695 / JCM 21032 / LMG 3331 / NBRC 15819 / NCTC 12168 / Alc 37) TaxID=439375 RepID=A6X8D0_BRUA4|nr:site-specific integrase [Brucella anthropi]ABS17484.1 phage integrase family protein [Brucella anthropi ATCC 49188]KAB2726278.1 tyrosine-type recombinase/integrase [Brucella anthropi]KAB2744614.1 tyrosine-type recombinase/integrase [Brucella anthropi]KAB2774643.1 tyrosine-type recombinase/integrase [Brucella anthropi]QQC26975.1 site-specific integrase [Brucella anthropi]
MMTADKPIEWRAQQLDTIAAVLPMNRRDMLAEILTDQDVETLRHLVNEGMGENTLRALTSDLAYLEAWSLAATGSPLAFPAPEALLLKFIAHHLWRHQQREIDPDHGMPAGVEAELRSQGFLRASGPHAPATVRRRLSNWSTLTRWRGLEGPFSAPSVKSALRLAVRATNRPRSRKSAQAITGDIMTKLLGTCVGDDLRTLRDRAILMVAFASGGRRRSEVARLSLEQLTLEEPVIDKDGNPLPSLSIRLGRTKTASAEQDEVVYLTGRPVDALYAWIAAAKIESGSLFRSVDRWNNVGRQAIDAQTVNAIVKARAVIAGLDPKAFSAHGLRSGYLTEAANRGIPLPEAMEQSRHRSVQQASDYYNNAKRRSGRASRLL